MSKIIRMQLGLWNLADKFEVVNSEDCVKQLFEEPCIKYAISYVMASPGSDTPGVDGLTRGDYLDDPKLLMDLEKEVKNMRGGYKSRPIRVVEIPKSNGKMRRIGISCIRDKVMQVLMRLYLEPIAEKRFHPWSYGFRPNRGCHDALHSLCNMMIHPKGKEMKPWAIEGDIRACFDCIDHTILMNIIENKFTNNKRILKYLEKMLEVNLIKYEMGGEDYWYEMGTPQGSIVSPLLANMYLNDMDWYLEKKRITFVRYADDFVIVQKDVGKESIDAIKEDLRGFLENNLKLELSAEKTLVTDMRTSKIDRFLGYEIFIKTKGVSKLTVKGNVRKIKAVPIFRISKSNLKNYRRKMKIFIKTQFQQLGVETGIKKSMAMRRGFYEYFKYGNTYRQISVVEDLIIRKWIFKEIGRVERIGRRSVYRRFMKIKNSEWMEKFKFPEAQSMYGRKPILGYSDRLKRIAYVRNLNAEIEEEDVDMERLRRTITPIEVPMRDCDICSQPAAHMHHIIPKGKGGGLGSNLTPLCALCHSIIGRAYKSVEKKHRKKKFRSVPIDYEEIYNKFKAMIAKEGAQQIIDLLHIEISD